MCSSDLGTDCGADGIRDAVDQRRDAGDHGDVERRECLLRSGGELEFGCVPADGSGDGDDAVGDGGVWRQRQLRRQQYEFGDQLHRVLAGVCRLRRDWGG